MLVLISRVYPLSSALKMGLRSPIVMVLKFLQCFVTYNITKNELIAWIPPPNAGTDVIFNGSNPTVKEIRAKHDFDHVQLITDLHHYLNKFVHSQPARKIYLLHACQAPKNVAKTVTYNGSLHTLEESPFEFTKLKLAMDATRAIKTQYEIELIRKANAISAQAHINVLRGIKNLENEAEIEAIFAATCISEQAKQQAYGIIAGSGENASTLHYVANNESLEGRQLVCLDASCEWKCYASDITRTFPISGEFTAEAKEIYDIVAKMQEECIAMIKPGVNYRDIHMNAHKVAIQGLMKVGLLQNGTFEELYKSGASVAFFPHGLGRRSFARLNFSKSFTDENRLPRTRSPRRWGRRQAALGLPGTTPALGPRIFRHPPQSTHDYRRVDPRTKHGRHRRARNVSPSAPSTFTIPGSQFPNPSTNYAQLFLPLRTGRSLPERRPLCKIHQQGSPGEILPCRRCPDRRRYPGYGEWV